VILMVRYSVAVSAGLRPRQAHHGRTPAELLANAAGASRVRADELDLSGVTVLIVEDHADSRDMLRQIVESFGARVAVTGDGREALTTAGWLRPGLVLCDLRMPVLDGFGFIDRLRADPLLSRTPVLAVTALASDDDVRRAWDAGFNGHLVKPIDYETVAAQLERVFWAHRKPKR
jgi:CheY-like chemotaxis protein